jgi:hypothetical protein
MRGFNNISSVICKIRTAIYNQKFKFAMAGNNVILRHILCYLNEVVKQAFVKFLYEIILLPEDVSLKLFI